MLQQHFFKTLFLLFFIGNVLTTQAQTVRGKATFYGGVAGSAGGNCGLPVRANDFMHAALNTRDYNGSQACGAFIRVTSRATGKSVVVQVVDRCPSCSPGGVDLTQQAFRRIDNPTKGIIDVTWKFVPSPRNNNIVVHFKPGSSKYHTEIQLRNLGRAVKKLEYKRGNGWVNMSRRLYNFFVETRGIPSPMTLRATAVTGQRLVFNNIRLRAGGNVYTGKQFRRGNSRATTQAIVDKLAESALTFKSDAQGIHASGTIKDWKLYNHVGDLVAKGNNTTDIDTAKLASGLYILVYNEALKFKYLKK